MAEEGRESMLSLQFTIEFLKERQHEVNEMENNLKLQQDELKKQQDGLKKIQNQNYEMLQELSKQRDKLHDERVYLQSKQNRLIYDNPNNAKVPSQAHQFLSGLMLMDDSSDDLVGQTKGVDKTPSKLESKLSQASIGSTTSVRRSAQRSSSKVLQKQRGSVTTRRKSDVRRKGSTIAASRSRELAPYYDTSKKYPGIIRYSPSRSTHGKSSGTRGSKTSIDSAKRNPSVSKNPNRKTTRDSSPRSRDNSDRRGKR